jgi:ABC-type lipoprotein export system ATPase subunit
VQPLKSLDPETWAGEFVVMLGPFGSGKFTLFNTLGWPRYADVRAGGLAGPRIDQSERGGADGLSSRPHRLRVPVYNFILRLTARENVELVAEIATDRFAD